MPHQHLGALIPHLQRQTNRLTPGLVTGRRGKVRQVNTVKDRLKQSHLHTIRCHRVGEHETASRLEKTGHLGQNLGAITGMQDRILTPDQISTGISHGHLLEGGVVHRDLLIQTGVNVQLPMAIVLHRGNVDRMNRSFTPAGQAP